jgi:hypothetical protein
MLVTQHPTFQFPAVTVITQQVCQVGAVTLTCNEQCVICDAHLQAEKKPLQLQRDLEVR